MMSDIESVFDDAGTPFIFMRPDSELFVNSRTLCMERGGEFM